MHDRENKIHIGFNDLNTYIERSAPRLLLHGHQHQERETTVGQTHVMGIFGWKIIEL